jgi:hypothetical protein
MSCPAVMPAVFRSRELADILDAEDVVPRMGSEIAMTATTATAKAMQAVPIHDFDTGDFATKLLLILLPHLVATSKPDSAQSDSQGRRFFQAMSGSNCQSIRVQSACSLRVPFAKFEVWDGRESRKQWYKQPGQFIKLYQRCR